MISMKFSGRIIRLTCSLMFVLTSILSGGTTASAQSLTTLASMTDGQYPWGSLVADANGNLFGTAELGGAGYGTVFEIARTSSGYASTPTTLVSFDNANGAYPFAGLIIDANGSLFGTAQQGGASGCGTVFEIAKTSTGYASTPTTLVDFDCTSGNNPEGGLLADANGNLFGTTALGGAYGNGTVFEIVKTSSGYATTPITLVSFDGIEAGIPQAGLIADANGNLYGTTAVGGVGYGVVFELARTTSGFTSSPTILVNFDNTHGATPQAALIADTSGNLFGTTNQGGASGYGVVFEIAKSTSGYASTPTILFNFDSVNGAFPIAGLTIDANGNLFGTASQGGMAGNGTAFEIVKTSGVYAGSPTTLVSFNGSNGAVPPTGLIADANGNLFSTTASGGSMNAGTVFEIAGSGFVPGVAPPVPPQQSNQFAGKPGSSNCIGKSTSALAHTYGGLAHAAPALGYASVSALQSAIANYCSN